MFDFRTDFADERVKIWNESKEKLDGIITEEEKISSELNVYRVKVINEEGSKKIQKKIGTYTTININDLDIISDEELQIIQDTLTKELKKIINIDGPILVVGLGNEDTTADSIRTKSNKRYRNYKAYFKI